MIQQTWLDNEDFRVNLVLRDYLRMWSDTQPDGEDNFALSEVSSILYERYRGLSDQSVSYVFCTILQLRIKMNTRTTRLAPRRPEEIDHFS